MASFQLYNNRYFIGDKIGGGSFGVVHKAEDSKLCETRAIKKIYIENMKSRELVETMNEIIVLSNVKHDNIIKYYEHFCDDSFLYLVMEFCEDGDLDRYLKKKKNLEDSLIIEWTKQIISALKYLHENNFIHRDLKPLNILIKSGKLKLGDFGISKKLYGTKHTNWNAGTVNYMSPEILNDEKYDNKCDVWALGVTFYQMLTNSLPFNGENEIKTKETPSLPLKYRNFEVFLKKLLMKIPNERFDIHQVNDLFEELTKPKETIEIKKNIAENPTRVVRRTTKNPVFNQPVKDFDVNPSNTTQVKISKIINRNQKNDVLGNDKNVNNNIINNTSSDEDVTKNTKEESNLNNKYVDDKIKKIMSKFKNNPEAREFLEDFTGMNFDSKNINVQKNIKQMQFHSSSKGSISITECCPKGQYIELENTNEEKEIEMGNWLLKRCLNNKEFCFKFPQNFSLGPKQTVRVWVKGNRENYPTDLVNRSCESWGIGKYTETFILNENGDKKASYIENR